MNIYAKHGDKVVCDTLDAGYKNDQEVASKYLKKGERYTIEETNVADWHTNVYLQEFPGIKFNSVFFEDV
tara:strand:+ start:176 stop:385 length:210 start_codon:yes stop_codon:yes gene_type:complete